MADATETKLAATVATWQKYVDNLFAALDRKLTPAKRAATEAKLAHYLDTLARNQRALAAYRAEYHAPAVEAVAIGPDPIPNNAQPTLGNFGCPPDFDPAAFESRYGFSIQTALDKVVTGILRPNLDRWQALVASSGGTFTQQNADYYKNGDVTKQKSVIAYFQGELSFEVGVLSYLGNWAQYLGCVDIAAIHDLGAA